MSKQPESNLTPAQVEIMELFWERGELGVAQVWKELASRRPVARNTVQTMLTRLAEKGWLRARAHANAFYFRAARQRSSAIGGMLRELIETAFAGSASGLVQMLLENRKLSATEVKRIRKLIDDAEAKR